MSKTRFTFLAVMLAIIPQVTAAQDQVRVLGVTAAIGGPAAFTLARGTPDRQYVTSTSPLITKTLVLAHLSGAQVKLDLVSDSVVKRVNPFAVERGGPRPYRGEYRLSRIATQRKPDGSDEHLEVFVTKGQDPSEKAYNVYDQRISDVLLAVFSASDGPLAVSVDLVLDLDNGLIVEVTVGERRK